MGSLVDELRRREMAARAEAEQLRGQIAELTERLAGVEEGGRPSKPESGNGLMPPRILLGYFIAWCLLVAVR